MNLILVRLNDFLLQINQVEQELVKLSSLELRKQLLSVTYGSTTMLKQRKTLVELLQSLLSQKSEREQQLEAWLSQMENIHEGGAEAANYWLLQYQRLMAVKPAGLIEAEEQLESSVLAVLEAAHATFVIPIFARHAITFSKLLDLTQEAAAEMGVGPATYNTIQSALQHHLASTKLVDTCGRDDGGERAPSAPPPEELDVCTALEDERSPSAPRMDSDEEAEDRVPSAPPVDLRFVEAECVICLEKTCTVVLMPCGHVCACYACSVPLTSCPMCRAGIYNKITIGEGNLAM